MQKLKLTCTIAASAAVCLASGCKSSRNWSGSIPEEATPQYEIVQLQKSEELVREAQRYEVAGNPAKAVEKYELAIATYVENPTAWHNVGLHYAKRGENLKAANAFKTAAELSPRDPRPLYELGALWEQLGYLEDAARWYDEALQRDPNHQNSLRRSILVDELRHKLNSTTAERLKVAMLAEREAWWINRFQRIYQLMAENQNSPYSTDDSHRPKPESEPMPADSISLPGVEPRHNATPRPPSGTTPANPNPAPRSPAAPPARPPTQSPAPLPKS